MWLSWCIYNIFNFNKSGFQICQLWNNFEITSFSLTMSVGVFLMIILAWVMPFRFAIGVTYKYVKTSQKCTYICKYCYICKINLSVPTECIWRPWNIWSETCKGYIQIHLHVICFLYQNRVYTQFNSIQKLYLKMVPQ